jgi:beta-lactamase family protein
MRARVTRLSLAPGTYRLVGISGDAGCTPKTVIVEEGTFETTDFVAVCVDAWLRCSPRLNMQMMHGTKCNSNPFCCQLYVLAGRESLGSARILSHPIMHPGATVGYRIEDEGKVLTYLTDHEPALGTDLETIAPEWISGFALAFGADLLVHDCQYGDDEYPAHVGWGHSSTSDVATFADKAKVDRLLLFHHDPMHDDTDLDAMGTAVRERWGVEPARCLVAAEGMIVDV